MWKFIKSLFLSCDEAYPNGYRWSTGLDDEQSKRTICVWEDNIILDGTCRCVGSCCCIPLPPPFSPGTATIRVPVPKELYTEPIIFHQCS